MVLTKQAQTCCTVEPRLTVMTGAACAAYHVVHVFSWRDGRDALERKVHRSYLLKYLRLRKPRQG